CVTPVLAIPPLPAFSLDAEQPDYDLDTEDEAFVHKLKKKLEITPLQFEEMIDRLEKGSGQQLVTLQEAKLLLKEDDELIREVFDYWTRKRKSCKSASLIPTVKQEKRDGSSTNDPYVAFRRRTEKMQTRKNRKNDEASYEKMLKLRRDLSRAVTILEMIKRREKSKRELLHLTLEIVEKRYSMADFGGEIMAEVLAQRALVKPAYTMPIIPLSSGAQGRLQDYMEDYKAKPEKTEVVRTKRKYEKKKPKIHSGSSEAEEENDPDGPFAFRRKAGCQYYASRLDQSGSWPWCSPSEGGLGDVRFRYSLTTLTVPRRCVGLARRRIGRGGRVLLDRAHTDFDNVIHGLDPEMLASHPRSQVDKFPSTSETNTSDGNPSPDLSQILLNIKSCRWRHFRPRTLPLHDPEGADACSRRLHRGLAGTTPAQSGTQAGGTSSHSRNGPGSTPLTGLNPSSAVAPIGSTEFLVSQGNLRAGIGETSPLCGGIRAAMLIGAEKPLLRVTLQEHAPVLDRYSGLISQTLDSVSAQFAASALVTTDQLTAFKAKEEVVLGIGVNGVLQASGVYKGLHLSSTAPASLHTSQSTTTAGHTFLQPSNATTPAAVTTQTSSSHGTAANSTTQVLIGSNIRLSMPSSGAAVNSIANLNARHIPRTINTVPPSALKLAATTNCQMPKVSAASSMDLVPR
ncbi:hypothetical protein JZ751_028748, partial [Albula glossodonta]